MRRTLPLVLPALLLAAATPATAGVTLIATGSINGSSAGAGVDLSGLTGKLENGLAGNILGGLGSGLAYAGGNTFLATPDRGPNATPYNSAIDDTVSYISRFQTLTLGLTKATSGTLPYALATQLTQTTLLSSPTQLTYGTGTAYNVPNGAPTQNTADTFYFTGRSDNFGPGNSGNPANARFDPESIRVSNDGQTVFVSDEYGPYVRQFDRATGKLVRTYALPADLDVAHLGTATDSETGSDNTSGRVANKGMEGLAITPDGKTLVGIMQAPLIQDAKDPATANMLRIVTIDIASGDTKEYGYQLSKGSGVSDIVAVSATKFLVDERDGKGLGDVPKGSTSAADSSDAKTKLIYQIDISNAKDITGKTGTDTTAGLVQKNTTAFLDIVAALKAYGLKANQIPAKIEGITFGQDVLDANGNVLHTLYIANDNDFLPGVAGTNQFFVFGFTDADLPGYVAQMLGASAVPEPASWALMVSGFGLLGAALRRDRRRVRVNFG